MITDNDKINTCIEKYGLDRDEAVRIIKSDDVILTIEELRIKYDYPELGIKYPDWLTPLEHRKMCSTTVRQMFNQNFAKFTTPEDMAGDLYVLTVVKLNQMKNHRMLKDFIVKQALNMYRNYNVRQKYWASRTLDDNVSDSVEVYNYDRLEYRDIEAEEVQCLSAVKSIKNREVRELLILVGYIIGGISAFETEFNKIVYNSDLVDRSKLLLLLEKLELNDEINRNKIDGKKSDMRKKKVTFFDVVKVMRLDGDIKDIREKIGYYLTVTKFIENFE